MRARPSQRPPRPASGPRLRRISMLRRLQSPAQNRISRQESTCGRAWLRKPPSAMQPKRSPPSPMATARRAPPPRRLGNSTSEAMVVSEVTRRFRVTGKVQGVYFRHSTRLEAERLALSGYARNLPDGSVEVAVRGPACAVGELHQWLHRGPKSARVAAVQEMELALDEGGAANERFEVL